MLFALLFSPLYAVDQLHNQILFKALDGMDLIGVDLFGLDLIKVKDGDEDDRGKTCVKAAVIQHESAVHCRRGGADDGADKPCDHTVFKAVASRNGAKSRGKGKTVDVCLGGKGPGNIRSRDQTDAANQSEKRGIAKGDGRNVFGMLTVCREGQCGKGHAHGGARKAYSLRQEGEDGRKPEDDVQIGENTKAVNAEIDQTQRHSEFVGEIQAVSCAGGQLSVIAKASAVAKEPKDQGDEKDGGEEGVNEPIVGTVKGFVARADIGSGAVGGNAQGLIKEAVDEDAENSDGKSRFIHIVSAVHRRCAGKERGDKKARKNTEHDGKNNAQHAETADLQGFSRGIVKEKIADEGCQRGGKHGNVQMIPTGMIRQHTINQHTDEGWPHIDEIQTVKAVGNHQNVCRKGGAVGVCAAYRNNQRAGNTAKPCIKKGAWQTPKGEVVGDKLGGTGENIPKIAPKKTSAHACDHLGNRGGNEKREVEEYDKAFEGDAVFP